jgi:hypothetical protein
MSGINSHTASTALGLASSALSSVKTALELGKKTTDLHLKKELNNAVDSVLELKVKVHELAEENRELLERLEQRETIVRSGTHGYWFKSGETDPLCPKCYEESGKTIYLPASERWSGGIRRDCRVCHSVYWEQQMNLNTGSIRPRSSWS